MIQMIIGIGVGVLLYAWHREQIRAAVERAQEEMEVQLKREKRDAMNERVRLYREICELQADMAKEYNRGRREALAEKRASEQLGKAYEGQRVKYALYACDRG